MTVPKECRHRLSCCIAAASTAAHRDSRGSGLVASGEWRHYEWQSGRAVGERTQQEMCALAGDLDLERKLALLRTERVCFYVRILDFDGRCRVARWVKAFVDLPNLSVGNESNISRGLLDDAGYARRGPLWLQRDENGPPGRIERMGRKVQTLTDELQALREERQNVIFDTGSDSDDAPVRKTGPKRKAASPRVSRAAKPEPLEQRISEARSVYADDDDGIAPALSPSPPPSPTKKAPPPSGPARTQFQSSAHAASSSHPPQWAPPPSHPYTAPAPHANASTSSMAPQSFAASGRRDDYQSSSACRGNSRGRGGDYGRGRGGGGKGKGRARDVDVAPALDDSRAQIIVGKVAWGTRSRDVFVDFCERIEACDLGPAPIPAFVSHPDKESYVRATYTGSQTETAHEQAEAMVRAWNSWCKTSKHVNTVAYLAD
ncbi:hypothetical protein B0H14DRAFT_2627958 [Mycena olivaceomarginata]|nr:hypothetical protein B0H14DRAFT_2627958 [Mycena olivaceomarginata]